MKTLYVIPQTRPNAYEIPSWAVALAVARSASAARRAAGEKKP